MEGTGQLISRSYAEQLGRVENYRSYLLQSQFLNAALKQDISEQQDSLNIQFTDRLVQVREMVDDNRRLWGKILRERAILALETTLSIETRNFRCVFEKLDEFTDLARGVEALLQSTVKKVWVGTGCVVDIDSINDYIETSSKLLPNLLMKHAEFFTNYPLVQSALTQHLKQLAEQVRLIQQIDTLLKDLKTRQDNRVARKFRDHTQRELAKYNDNSALEQAEEEEEEEEKEEEEEEEGEREA